MLMHDIGTSFAFSWLISRLAGTLPRLVGAIDGEVDKVVLGELENEELDNEVGVEVEGYLEYFSNCSFTCSFPLLFFSA